MRREIDKVLFHDGSAGFTSFNLCLYCSTGPSTSLDVHTKISCTNFASGKCQ